MQTKKNLSSDRANLLSDWRLPGRALIAFNLAAVAFNLAAGKQDPTVGVTPTVRAPKGQHRQTGGIGTLIEAWASTSEALSNQKVSQGPGKAMTRAGGALR